jgi:hypothetical protein
MNADVAFGRHRLQHVGEYVGKYAPAIGLIEPIGRGRYRVQSGVTPTTQTDLNDHPFWK